MSLDKDEEIMIDALETRNDFWTPARRKKLSAICEKLGVMAVATPIVQVLTKENLDLTWLIMVFSTLGLLLLWFSIAVETEVK